MPDWSRIILALLNLAAAVSAAFLLFGEPYNSMPSTPQWVMAAPLALWIIVPLLNVWAILSPRQ
jgi:hypothetical protein